MQKFLITKPEKHLYSQLSQSVAHLLWGAFEMILSICAHDHFETFAKWHWKNGHVFVLILPQQKSGGRSSSSRSNRHWFGWIHYQWSSSANCFIKCFQKPAEFHFRIFLMEFSLTHMLNIMVVFFTSLKNCFNPLFQPCVNRSFVVKKHGFVTSLDPRNWSFRKHLPQRGPEAGREV